MRNKTIVILFLIIMFAGVFRFWQLSSYPVSLTIDEVAVGYNAYSILKTGHDEHGKFLPLAFLSIGDYKAPLHIYLAAPTIAIFGLTEFGVRFSMALFSTLTIIPLFLLIRQLLKNENIALLASFLLAITPWHIHLARFSYEVSLGLFLIVTAVWFFLRSLKKKGQLLWLSAILLVLSMYAYHAERVFTPLFAAGIIAIYWQKLKKYKTALVKSAVFAGILLIPLLYILFNTAGQTRARSVFIAKDPVLQEELLQGNEISNFPQNLLDNNFLIIANHWTKKYLNYFDPIFLFFSGMDFTQPGRPDVGLFYLFELPLFLMGIWFVFFKRKYENTKFILFWLIIGPVVASLTIEEQHFARNLVTLPPLLLLVSIGGFEFWKTVDRQKLFLKTASYMAATSVIILSVSYFLTIYLINYPIQRSEYWQYGWKQAALYAWQNKDEYREIVVDPTFGSEGPNIVGTPPAYFLFYGKYDPELYQKSSRRTDKLSTNFENFTFRPIYWPNDRSRANTLFIGSPWVLPRKDVAEPQIKKVIKFKNGVDGLLIVESKGNEIIPLE